MGIFLNILVIIAAVIVFLIIYYRTLNEDKKNQDYTLPFRKIRTDFESGEEFSVDTNTMSVQNKIEDDDDKPSIIKSSENIARKKQTKNYNQESDIDDKDYNLNDRYNKNFIRLFNRDPNYLFSYWEINTDEYYKNTPYLRVYKKKSDYRDIEIDHNSTNWYLESEADKEYWISIGYKRDGVFYPLDTSEKVQTPLDCPSNIIDEHWMTIEGLSRYSYRVDMDSISLVKNIETRKVQEEIKGDSLTLVNK